VGLALSEGNMKLKLTWEEFVSTAVKELQRNHDLVVEKPVFMVKHHFEPDCEASPDFLPAYVELELG
jgi:hypothetical protein